MTAECTHVRLGPDTVDQTLGVVCLDCDTLLAWCWMERHIPESLWNRVCVLDADCRPCEQNRDDVCAVCEEPIA